MKCPEMKQSQQRNQSILGLHIENLPNEIIHMRILSLKSEKMTSVYTMRVVHFSKFLKIYQPAFCKQKQIM